MVSSMQYAENTGRPRTAAQDREALIAKLFRLSDHAIEHSAYLVIFLGKIGMVFPREVAAVAARIYPYFCFTGLAKGID